MAMSINVTDLRSQVRNSLGYRMSMASQGQAALQAVLPVAQENAAHFETELTVQELAALRLTAAKLLLAGPCIVAKLQHISGNSWANCFPTATGLCIWAPIRWRP
ncbi:hypothetical protein [Leisingera sp. M523]|uniref:hypothetical protein n=1 Tax=Leisingera sp. M523 TaxID=2867013 RepID=UPI0021A8100C|nr:hypothetical protein [Leisingera sp. M523]UWQ29367.1 hypothetical protein K3557_02035 [Leisingera sp. M523]